MHLRAIVVRTLRRLNDDLEQCNAAIRPLQYIQLFFEHYVPVCQVLGWMVRRCYWEGRQRGTGVWARDMLRMSLLTLHGIVGSDVRVSPYTRSICIALLSWSQWHDDLPACAYVEESCEARLSVLASRCVTNTQAITVQQVSDLYVDLGRPTREYILRNITEFLENCRTA